MSFVLCGMVRMCSDIIIGRLDISLAPEMAPQLRITRVRFTVRAQGRSDRLLFVYLTHARMVVGIFH